MSNSRVLILSVGIIPTFRVLHSVYRTLSLLSSGTIPRTTAKVMSKVLLQNVLRLDPRAVAIVSTILEPVWTVIIENTLSFKRIYTIFLCFFIFISFRPLILILFRYFIGIIFSCLGIVWSEVFNNFTTLKDLATNILLFNNDNFKLNLFIKKIK